MNNVLLLIKESFKRRFSLLFIFLTVCILLVSCYTEKDVSRRLSAEDAEAENKRIGSGGDAGREIRNIAQGRSQQSIDNRFSDDSLVRSIQVALENGQYAKVIDLSGEDQSDVVTYYRGIAYYVMSVETDRYSASKREGFRVKAIEGLKKIAYESEDVNLRARSLLWYGVTLHVSYEDLANKKKAIAAFYEFERLSSLKNTVYFNDALYYSGLTYMQMGWFGVARGYFKRVARADGADKEIFDYSNNRYYGLAKASKRGLERLASYMDGTDSNYRR